MTTICIFGASTAWGAGDTEKGGWAQRFILHHVVKTNYDDDVYNLGISGDDSAGLLKRFKSECEARAPGAILITIGTNDSYIVNGKPNIDIPEYKENLNKLFTHAKKFTKKVAFISANPVDETKTKPIPWAKDKSYENSRINAYNNAAAEVCKKNNILFIDMKGVITISDLSDGVHPNPQGHEKMFKHIYNVLIKQELI